ncbi:hypothetical protein [Halodesulfovibrio marinisediminis]|uniref:Uncharacterized protein n=1 Tax=Halodesulfovibrio marinisediminis DSM 17456 TaxID=1121457 RepID=A0A1N6HYY6_9BACT|nr:hypothetical protein [Halodesulfovibrio marinisediminis]SIO25023.1 hypothetical protein SAMN02745161_2292 [Halodesulfovibrio marinisediminis DSM 17456]
MREGWFKENGATVVSMISVLLSAFIVYSSNASLKEKYEAEQKIEQQTVAVEYYKWWQLEFQKSIAEYLAALDLFRDANIRIKVIVSKDGYNQPEILNASKDVDSAKQKLRRSHYQLVCLLDNENGSHRNLLFFLEKVRQQVLRESVLSAKGKDYKRDLDLEAEYYRLINEVRDDAFNKLELISKFNESLPSPS